MTKAGAVRVRGHIAMRLLFSMKRNTLLGRDREVLSINEKENALPSDRYICWQPV